MSGTVNNCKDAAKNMADTMQDNLEGRLTILKSQLQELAISFGDLLMPTVWSIVHGLQGMVDVLNAMPDGVKRVIMIVALLAADMVVSPQMAVVDGGMMTGTGSSGSADLTAGIVAALKDVLGDQKGQQGDLVRHGVVRIPVSFSATAKWLKKLAGYAKLDKISVQYFDVETAELKLAEMYVTGYKAKLKKDTSYKGLWTVSFTLKEM